MPVCGACNALFSGGDGQCPACGADTILETLQEARFDIQRVAIIGAILVPVSSALGVQAWYFGFFWIWSQSLLADLLFTAGTVGAHLAAVWLASRVPNRFAGLFVAFTLAWALHWLVYGLSWSAFLAAAGDDEFASGFGFVASVGAYGLTVAAMTATGTYAYLRRDG